jgi:hypothetical protein
VQKPVPPMFCNSHLLMRIDITTSKPPTPSLYPDRVDTAASTFNSAAHMPDYTKLPPGGTVVDKEIGEGLIDQLTNKALNGYWDRRMVFKKQVGAHHVCCHCHICSRHVCGHQAQTCCSQMYA